MLAIALMNTRLGSLADLPSQLSHHTPFLLVWRLLLYAGIAALWWLVARLRTDPTARQQLAAVCAMLILAVELTRGMGA